MFGNSKPFGTASAFGTSSFGTTSTPFGQNTTAFGAKPATSNVFGTSAFGVATPNTGGLFGSSTPATGTGLFGQTSTAFGAPASTSTGTFGFGATSTSGGLFGNATPSTQSSGGLFGGSSTSAFGAPRPAFGGFGTTTTGTGLFGQATNTGTSLFGASGGFTTAAQTGTPIKFNAPTGTDTMMKGGVSTSIGTRHQCITCMKEYENKSLEELRVEDYAANRKGGAATGMGFGTPAQQPNLFGTPAASTSGFSFGSTTQAKPLFGTTGGTNTFGSGGLFGQPAQTQNTGLFGKSVGFGTATTSAAPVFNFGASTGTSLFGQNNQTKPLFGQTTGGTGLFGNTATTQATGFGTTTGFGGFGATTQQSTGLFGAKPTGFGATNTTTTNTFSFGNTNMSSGGLFGQKPSAPAFGTSTGFGTSTTGFGSFGNTSGGTGLFGQNKPATSSVFGGSGTGFGSSLGTGFSGSSFSMGLGSNTGTGLFGNTNANKTSGFSFGNTGSTGFNFGSNPSTSNFNFGGASSLPAGSDLNNPAVLQQAQQQILAMTIAPFGDSPLFRNPIKDSTREAEVLKPTNPSAQKALLNDNHYKVALLPTAKMKPKPWSPVHSGKALLFDGLEDEEPSLSNIAFMPKRSVKKLVLKNISSNQSTVTLTSNFSPNQSTRINVSISLNRPENSLSGRSENSSQQPVPLTVDITENSNANSSNRDVPGGNIVPASSEKPPSILDDSIHLSKKNDSTKDNANDTIAELHSNKERHAKCIMNAFEETYIGHTDSCTEETPSKSKQSNESCKERVHETGIILTRPGYYTIPPLADLIPLIDENGNCFVKDFTIGREGYGRVTFPGVINVAGLNLDEIVHFRKKEITVYPDESIKPPVGDGLNRKAEVILEDVWPTNKTSHTPIKDPEVLNKLGYRERIVKCTSRLGAKFIDYKPETGSWIFEVDHFSKYGLEDSDEEMDIPKPPENKSKGILPPPQMAVVNGQIPSDNSVSNLPLKPIVYHVEDEAMEGITSLPTQKDYEFDQTEGFFTEVYSPTKPILNSGIDPERIQGMKASFFQDDMNDDMWGPVTYKTGRDVMSVSKTDDANKENEVISFFNKMQTKGSEVFKKQRHYEYPDNQFSVSVKSPFKNGEIGIQKSMSSLSLSTLKQAEWLSSLPLVKTSSEHLPYHKKTVPILPNKIALRPFKQSVLYNKQHLLADAGYFMGRSFRCGWRADGIYVHLEPPKEDTLLDIWNKLVHGSNIPHSDTHGKSFMLSMTKLPTATDAKPEEKSIQETLTGTLKLQLQNSASSTEDGAPLFVPKPGVEPVHALAEFFESLLKAADPLNPDAGFLRQSAYVWNLLVSLWGTIGDINQKQDAPTTFPEDTPNYLSEGTSNYVSQMARREALSQWLIKTTESIITSEVANCSQRNGYLAKIFLYMSGRRISDAVKLAQENHDYRLSLLLSQAEGNLLVRKLISNQLLNWEQNGAYKFIKYNRIALYALLSGMLIWENVYETVNCCKNRDWKQALALHLWYHCSPNSSIQDALKKYDESFQGIGCHGKYSMPPYPPYIDIKNLTKDIMDDSEMVYDTCYHLLKLYCDRSHRLDQLLMPETYSEDHLDYRLSWLLQLSLSSIGYNISSDLMCTLHMNFASQLESISMWPWAVFVLLHHPDKEWRIKYVKEILLRHVSLDQSTETEEKEKFLVEQLLVPVKWIFEAKAVLARTLGKHAEEAWYLLKAESWNESHCIVIKYLASDAVINEDYDYLMKYLSELALPERSCFILDWASGGQVYLDYINMCQVVQGVLSRETSAYDLEKFTPEVVSLCNRLSSIPTSSLKDRLSVAEMAKKTGTILRSIAMLQVGRTKDSSSLTRLGSILKNLPMPHDYAMSEHRFIEHCFLEEIPTEI